MQNTRFSIFFLSILLPCILFSQKEKSTETILAAHFSDKKTIKWIKHFKGRIDDVSDISISLATDSLKYVGILTYLQSGDQFKIEGKAEGPALILDEWDINQLKTGSLLILLYDGKLYGEWSNIDGSIGASITGEETKTENLYHRKCNDNKWINRYRSYYLDQEIDLIISYTNENYIWGSLWVAAEEKYYTIQAEIDEDKMLKGSLTNGIFNSGTIEVKLDNVKAVNAKITFASRKSHTFQFKLQENMLVDCRNQSDYICTYDIIFPKTKCATCNTFLEKQSNLWVSNCKNTLKSKKLKSNPNTRAAVRASAWTELHLWDERYISGLFLFSNTWDSQLQTKAFTFDVQRNKVLVLEDLFVKKFNETSWLAAYALKESPQLSFWKMSEFRTWIKKEGFPYLTIRHDGFLLSSDFHPVFGKSEVLVPWRDVKPYLKKSALKFLIKN